MAMTSWILEAIENEALRRAKKAHNLYLIDAAMSPNSMLYGYNRAQLVQLVLKHERECGLFRPMVEGDLW